MVALNLQQFQYNLKKCFFVKLTSPKGGGGRIARGGLQERGGGGLCTMLRDETIRTSVRGICFFLCRPIYKLAVCEQRALV